MISEFYIATLVQSWGCDVGGALSVGFQGVLLREVGDGAYATVAGAGDGAAPFVSPFWFSSSASCFSSAPFVFCATSSLVFASSSSISRFIHALRLSCSRLQAHPVNHSRRLIEPLRAHA